MTSEGPDAGKSPSPESTGGAPQPVSGAYESPPFPYDPTAYPPPPAGYPPPPPYGAAPGYTPEYGLPGYGVPGYGPAGYAPPGYPAPGYPAQGYPPYGAYGAPAPRTNNFAIAALVTSVISLCGLGSIAGIVFGVVALNQIKVSGESGRGMAIAGIVVGAVTLLLSMVFLIAVMAA